MRPHGWWLAVPVALALLAGSAARAQETMADHSPRVRLSLNADWYYLPGDSADKEPPVAHDPRWQAITLPHTWNATDALDRNVPYRRGIGWYRRSLHIPPALQDRRLFLYFEGANQVADVWVNGRPAGHHIGGYTAFAMDVTDLVAADGANNLVVRVDNRHNPDVPPLSADFTFYGGIYRDVWLLATDPVHVEVLDHASPGVYVDAPGLTADRAVVRTRVLLHNQGARREAVRVVSRVLDPAGKVVAQATSSLEMPAGSTETITKLASPIEQPRLWSPDEPNLYVVRTDVYAAAGGAAGKGAGASKGGRAEAKGTGSADRLVDRVETPLGLRFYAFDEQKGFLLNGRPIQLHGVNRHQDFAGLGNALPDAYHRRDLRTIKESGFNFLRLAHYPQGPVLDEADRLGIIVWEEIPVVNRITLSSAFSANAESMLVDMIRQHYNHPAVFFWGYMNEIMLVPPRPAPAGYADSVVALARRLNARSKAEDAARPTVMAIFGQDPVPALHDVSDILGLNLYFGWYYGQARDFGAFVDSMHAAKPARGLIISEYGAGGDERVHATSPVPFDYSMEYQQRLHEATFPEILARPWLVGSALWNMFDFGAFGRDDARPNLNDKGLFTFDRRPKETAYYYRAKLTRTPFVHIASRSWAVRAGSSAADRQQRLVVYGNTASVELVVDGRSAGVRPMENGRAEFTVTLHDGDNVLEARGREKDVTATDRLVVRYEDRALLFGSSPGTAAEIAVNAGAATQYVRDGVAWEADRQYAPGGWGYIGGRAANTHHRILGTTDDPLLQTTREGASAYRFDLPDGRYEVEVRLVETLHDAAGERVFGVVVNGVPLEPSLDLADTPGRWHARVLEAVVEAVGGEGVRVALPPSKGESTVSAIRVRRVVR